MCASCKQVFERPFGAWYYLQKHQGLRFASPLAINVRPVGTTIRTYFSRLGERKWPIVPGVGYSAPLAGSGFLVMMWIFEPGWSQK